MRANKSNENKYLVKDKRYLLFENEWICKFLGYMDGYCAQAGSIELLHPDERRSILRLGRQLAKILDLHPEVTENFCLRIANRYRDSSGDYRKVLQQVTLKRIRQGRLEARSTYIDITQHSAQKQISVEIRYRKQIGDQKVKSLLETLKRTNPLPLSKRQKEVLKVWGESMSTEIASKRLGISKTNPGDAPEEYA